MTNNENTIERRVDSLETKFEMFMRLQDERFNNFIKEMQDFKTEMRQQNEMRANEIRDLQKRQDAAQAKHDADMKQMNAKIDASLQTFTQQLHSNFVQTMIGVGAIVAAVGGLIVAVLK